MGIAGAVASVPEHAIVQIPGFKWQVDKGYIYWNNKSGIRENFDRHIEIPLAVLWRPVTKTCYQVILLGKTFTDYAVPFLVSALALGTCGFSGWNGSLYKLILG